MSEEKKVLKCISFKLKSLGDLARFASAMATLGHGTYIIHFEKSGRHYYGIYAIFRDYYKLYGLPLFYYIERNEEIKGKYILVHTDERGERVEASNGTKPGWISIPIIDLEKPPEIVDV